jgi:plasmid replication initiation protein
MRFLRAKPPQTCMDTIDDETWARLNHDEQRLFYAVERRQRGRSTAEQYANDLADWRLSIKLREQLHRKET